VCEEVQTDRSPGALKALEFTFASPYVPLVAELRAYAATSFPPGRPILAGARDLTHRIFSDFKYQPGSTDLGTGVTRAFAMRRGVCQDFAHIQIACLRSLGLPARYVSGYLLTRPAEGKERLVGADASHAWLAVWVPGHDWVDLDPTNDLIPGREHITIGWGRDYGDVSPVSGVMFGGGAHEVTVAVDVLAAG
jgi:transglutaminase-like putative cysteine protease